MSLVDGVTLVKVFDRVEAAIDGAVARGRKRSRVFDHVWRAGERFNDVLGGRLAAAISYYGFFAAFSLVVVIYSILRRLVGEQGGVVAAANAYLNQALPFVQATADQVGAGEVTAIGSIALVVTGVGWVEALRTSQRAIWRLNQHPGQWLIRWLVDLGMLVGLGILLAASLATTAFINAMLDRLTRPGPALVGEAVLRSSTPLLEFAVNIVLAAAILAAVPRLRLSPRRLLPPALFVALGIQLLNTLGRWYISSLSDRPAYQLVAGAVGLLVYLYLLNQLILFGASIAATARAGKMTDLADAPDHDEPPPDGGHDHDRHDRDLAANNVGEPHAWPGNHPR